MADLKLVHELEAKTKAAALTAYEAVHGFAPAMDFAPDRAWLEGYACALAAHPAAPVAQGDAEDAARYRAFFAAGLPITFMGTQYSDKASLDAAIDAYGAQELKGDA